MDLSDQSGEGLSLRPPDFQIRQLQPGVGGRKIVRIGIHVEIMPRLLLLSLLLLFDRADCEVGLVDPTSLVVW